ncbi:Alpha/Beta hydrolase protein [Mycena capillaripes]|nr:Alpha/Beta hydrolase protein [Mycena capillaripes]
MRLRFLWHNSFVFLALVLPGAALGEPTEPFVNTTSGFYVGVHDAQHAVDVFSGIRFAAPPVRFAPAAPIGDAPPWLQNATKFGADCPQLSTILGAAGLPAGPPLLGPNQSEDCLFVNVWRPAGTSTKERLPILVYIFGGGYFAGSGSEWNGIGLVRRSVKSRKPIIFVTFNYRTGVLGFMGSAQAPLSALNVGLQDQRDALRFIQDNAEAFGGDGSRITIAGESAGGSGVHMHYLYPDSRRTFHAGISSSGTSLVINTPACEWHDRPGGAYELLGNFTGCGSGAGSFRCLQNMPFDTFWPLALKTYQPPGGGFPLWSVTCKGPPGSLIDEYPVQKVIGGDFLDLPIITGTNRNEGNFVIGTTFLDMTPQPSPELENSFLNAFIAAQATNFRNASQETLDELLALYAHPTDKLSNSSLYNRAAQFTTDYSFLAPQRLFLKHASAEERRQDVWAYEFEQHLPGAPDFLGAFHTSDLYYLDMGFSPVPAQKLKLQMQDFYISFVNDLSPGPFWPKYTEQSKIAMRLLDGAVGPVADMIRRTQTDFLNQVDVMKEFGRFG